MTPLVTHPRNSVFGRFLLCRTFRVFAQRTSNIMKLSINLVFISVVVLRGEPDPVSSSVRLIRAESRMGRRIKAPEIPHIPAYFMLHMSLECLCRKRGGYSAGGHVKKRKKSTFSRRLSSPICHISSTHALYLLMPDLSSKITIS